MWAAIDLVFLGSSADPVLLVWHGGFRSPIKSTTKWVALGLTGADEGVCQLGELDVY